MSGEENKASTEHLNLVLIHSVQSERASQAAECCGSEICWGEDLAETTHGR